MATTILISPLGRQTSPTSEAIKLDILATDSTLFDSYDRIEVWKSTTGEGGIYFELTSGSYEPARLPIYADSPPDSQPSGPNVFVVGSSIVFSVNQRGLIQVTFSGTDPLTYLQVAQQITDQSSGNLLGYITDLGLLAVQTILSGVNALLSVKTLTDKAVNLRLYPGTSSQGKDARLTLTSGTSRYAFNDPFGSSTYFYKIRFRNSFSGSVSEFSLPQGVRTRSGVDSSNLVSGIADLVQSDGRPLINQAVSLHSEADGSLIDGRFLAGTDVSKLTDINGHVEFVLVRGQKFTVSVPGTSLYREITAPIDPAVQVFNLFDPDIASDDVFKVSIPKIVVAERRSL